ncbi:hypothetical protein ES708_16665 [subsurface metagenome]
MTPPEKGGKLLKEYSKMSKHVGARLGFPPRYGRNDPRNKARQAAGAALGRHLLGYDIPVRKVRNRNGSRVVTIPTEVWESMGIDFGDELRFRLTSKPSDMTATLIKRLDVPANRQRGYDPMMRKVWRNPDSYRSKAVTIPAQVCSAMGIDFGDELLFSPTPKPDDMTITVIKKLAETG